MALLFFDGFNTYGTAGDAARAWDSSTAIQSLVTGRRASSKAAFLGNGAQILTKTVGDKNTLIAGFAAYSNAPTVATTLLTFKTGTGEQISLRRDGTAQLYVSRNGTTLWSSGSDPMYRQGVSSWWYLEFKVTFDTSAGSWSLRVNGSNASLVSQTGVNTAAQGGTTASSVQFHGGNSQTLYDTDIYICDDTGSLQNDMLGDCRIDPHALESDGTYEDYTLSSGVDSFALLDEATPNSDTDYVYSSTPGHRTSLNVASMAFTPTYIHGIAVNTYARKDDSGSRDMKNFIRTNGANYESSVTNPLTTGYLSYRDIWTVNPATGVLFTQAEIDAIEVGFKVEA